MAHESLLNGCTIRMGLYNDKYKNRYDDDDEDDDEMMILTRYVR